MNAINTFISAVKFNSDGLVAAIAQEVGTKQVLMMAWMNEESLRQTLTEKQMIYYSRSRKRLWYKGESSGHQQKVVTLALDCDGDAILATVEQVGGIACHTGRKSCFYKEFSDIEGIIENSPVLIAPEKIYQ